MNGSYAITAMVLIALDHHTGHWCSLAWIANRVMAPIDIVRNHCQELLEHDQVQRLEIEGREYYGVNADPCATVELVQ